MDEKKLARLCELSQMMYRTHEQFEQLSIEEYCNKMSAIGRHAEKIGCTINDVARVLLTSHV